jgi:dihydroorotase-like cyclic amidohydrolase
MRHDTARLGGDLRVRAGRIEAIGHLDPDADEQVIDARGCVELLLSGRTTVADHP